MWLIFVTYQILNAIDYYFFYKRHVYAVIEGNSAEQDEIVVHLQN